MARRVYFAFHYKDVISFRANVVRNCGTTQDSAGFFDASLWEETKKQGDLAIKRMINAGLQNTSVTAVLAGSETYSRRWVKYEIIESFKRSNGIFNIHINKIPDKDKQTFLNGPNPLDSLGFRIMGSQLQILEYIKEQWIPIEMIPKNSVSYNFGAKISGRFSDIFSSVDWVTDDGYNNFSKWVEIVARQAGKQVYS
ncbi:MAG: TIR domain-containing protein [Candidatus Gastranaerophilaceae bacterium]